MADDTKACVVCGQGSPRKDWIQKTPDGKLVACDNHTKEEFQKAVATVTGTGTPKTVPPSTPQQAPSGPVVVKDKPATVTTSTVTETKVDDKVVADSKTNTPPVKI